MTKVAFPIPPEFRDKLRYVEALDNRPMEEILKSLDQYRPVTSEKNIWAFWHSGLRSMPSWCQRNIVNWIRLNGPEWTVRVLDQVKGSSNNALKYLSEDIIPPIYLTGEMTGPFVGQHSADLIRGACLYVHGGVWLDVGILLFRSLERMCWSKLESALTPFEVSVMHMGGTGISNHFIAARKQSPLIKHWHDLFAYLWRDRTDCTGLSTCPLLAPVLAAGRFHGDKDTNHFGWEHKCEPQLIMDYGSHILAWQRVILTEDAGDGFNGADYFTNKVLLLEVVSESWRAESIVGWRGSQLFDALSTRIDAPPESEAYQLAFKTVMSILAESSMQKVYRGKQMLKYPALGTLWDEEQNKDKDHEAGTFAELLRYGSVHFEQTRDIVYVENPRPPVTLKKRLLEI